MSEHGHNISSTIFDSSNIWCLDTAASFRMQNHPMAMTEYAIPFIQFKLSPNFKV